ncbi:hypothetical protein TRAPUB_3469 [Trametes pubescens]|uniref:Uncharacterized protein n=1 Tax=Trametes pubescens TaxID=154538 RepID=A0A1M2VDH6_TRAPU|nr:hypothetical protein TRAPUB_3469 [Trametes pubescens]
MFLPAGSCLVQPRPKPKTQPQPPRPRAAAPSTEVAHRHAHLYDYKPLAGAQYQTLKCKLIFLHEARKRDSITSYLDDNDDDKLDSTPSQDRTGPGVGEFKVD